MSAQYPKRIIHTNKQGRLYCFMNTLFCLCIAWFNRSFFTAARNISAVLKTKWGNNEERFAGFNFCALQSKLSHLPPVRSQKNYILRSTRAFVAPVCETNRFRDSLKPGFHIVVSVVRKKFIGQIEFISYNKLYLSFLLYWAVVREVSIKHGFHIVVSVVSVVRKKFIGQI